MNGLRMALGAAGALVAAYGGWLLVSRADPPDLVHAAVWLASGVLLHDVVLTAGALAVGGAATRLLPPAIRTPAVIGLVVLGTLTVVALPVLGRFGARPDNPTLLDRPYLASWMLVASGTATVVLVAGLVRSRRARRQED